MPERAQERGQECKRPQLSPGPLPLQHQNYRFAVLLKIGRFANVVDTIVMSPRELTVYTRPARNETDVRLIAFVVEPAVRVPKSYTPCGNATNVPPALYATAAPTAPSTPVVWFFAYNVCGVEFEIAFTKRLFAHSGYLIADHQCHRKIIWLKIKYGPAFNRKFECCDLLVSALGERVQ